MKVTIDNKRVKGICSVTISFGYNASETELIKRFDYPEVQVGGTFSDEEITFSLEETTKKFSGFPHKQSFDGVELSHDLAKKRADLYQATMEERIKTVWTNFKAIPNDFGGEQVYTI